MTIAAAFAAAGLLLPASAGANAYVAVQLFSQTGEGSFTDTVGCPAGDGPSWRYHFSGDAEPGTPRLTAGPDDGPLGGRWSSTFAVHDAGEGQGYLPSDGTRIAVDAYRGGQAFFRTPGGDCANTNLSLDRSGDDATAEGYVPLVADGGTGAMRGLTGEAYAYTYLELGKGADNGGALVLEGELDVTDPEPRVTGATARWASIGDYLARRLTVTAAAANPAGAGHAYDLALRDAPGYAGAPQSLGTLPAGGATSFTLRLANAQPGRTYSLPTTLTTRDGLGAQMPPVTSTVTFSAPATP